VPGSRSFEIERRDDPDRTVLGLVGEFDLAAEPVLLRELETALPSPTLVLDLTRVTFMDSTGLRLLLEADAHARDNGHRCMIVRGPGVHRVIEEGLLASRLDVVERLPDGV
jgi:anti-sigma B factor antagonist